MLRRTPITRSAAQRYRAEPGRWGRAGATLPHLDALVSIGNSMEHLHPAVARGRPVIRACHSRPSHKPFKSPSNLQDAAWSDCRAGGLGLEGARPACAGLLHRLMEAEGPLLLTDLPLPLLEHVLLLLDKRTICALAACSLRLHRIARDDGLWRRLCERSFPHTDARRWLNTREELFRRRSADGLLPPDSFRCAPRCATQVTSIPHARGRRASVFGDGIAGGWASESGCCIQDRARSKRGGWGSVCRSHRPALAEPLLRAVQHSPVRARADRHGWPSAAQVRVRAPVAVCAADRRVALDGAARRGRGAAVPVRLGARWRELRACGLQQVLPRARARPWPACSSLQIGLQAVGRLQGLSAAPPGTLSSSSAPCVPSCAAALQGLCHSGADCSRFPTRCRPGFSEMLPAFFIYLS